MGNLYKTNYESMGGVIKASSWSEAKTYAKSFILAVAVFTPPSATYNRTYSIMIPKELTEGSGENYFTVGSYISSTNNGHFQVQKTTGTGIVYWAGSLVATSSVTISYYYD